MLALSSYVASGSVGLRAALSVMPAAGIELIALPTTVLSGHPGHDHTAGRATAPDDLEAMIEALRDNGQLDGLDAVLTGYLPVKSLVEITARAIATVKSASPNAVVMVDPVLGDDPVGLYIDREAAMAIGDALVPLADIVTPNRFELAYLTGADVATLDDAFAACRLMNVKTVLATSVPTDKRSIGNLYVGGERVLLAKAPRRQRVPHGTGDLFAAVTLAELVNGNALAESFSNAVMLVAKAIDVSNGAHDIALEKLDWQASGDGIEFTEVRP